MKILLSIHHHLDPDSGAPGCTLKTGSHYQKMGHQVLFYSFDNLPSVLGRTFSEILFPLFLAAKIFSLVWKNNIDVIDASTADGWVWGIIGPVLFRKRPVLVTRSHGLEHLVHRMQRAESAKGTIKPSIKNRLFGRLKLRIVQLSMRRADAVFMLNSQELAFAINNLGISPERAFLVTHGIDRCFLGIPITPVTAEKDTAVKIALIGSFIPRKGIHYSVPALSRVLEQYDFVEVLFLGTGCGEKVIYDRFQGHLHKRIEVLPHYRHQDLPTLLLHSHIVLFPSLCEGFGMTLLEAMACGLAPVASSIEGPLEFVRDTENGLLVAPGDVDLIEKALRKLITDRTLLETLRSNAHKTAQGYTWNSSAEQQIAFYQKIVVNGEW